MSFQATRLIQTLAENTSEKLTIDVRILASQLCRLISCDT